MRIHYMWMPILVFWNLPEVQNPFDIRGEITLSKQSPLCKSCLQFFLKYPGPRFRPINSTTKTIPNPSRTPNIPQSLCIAITGLYGPLVAPPRGVDQRLKPLPNRFPHFIAQLKWTWYAGVSYKVYDIESIKTWGHRHLLNGVGQCLKPLPNRFPLILSHS